MNEPPPLPTSKSGKVVVIYNPAKDKSIQAAYYLPPSISYDLPAMVRNELNLLSPQRQHEFIEEYYRRTKSTGIAFLLWFTGIFFLSFHYAYVKKWGIQIVFWLTFGGFFLWWFIDLFRLSSMVSDYNKDVAIDVLRSMKAIRSDSAFH